MLNKVPGYILLPIIILSGLLLYYFGGKFVGNATPAIAPSEDFCYSVYGQNEYNWHFEELMSKATKGDAYAQSVLGMYYLGDPYPATKREPDYAKAAKWLQRAADQGIAAAQYKLADLYLTGKGVEKDLKKTYFWIKVGIRMDAPEFGESPPCSSVDAYKTAKLSLDMAEKHEIEKRAMEWKSIPEAKQP